MAAESWLNAEKRLIDLDEWESPAARVAKSRMAENPLMFREWAEEPLQRPMRESTRAGYRRTLRREVYPRFEELGKVFNDDVSAKRMQRRRQATTAPDDEAGQREAPGV